MKIRYLCIVIIASLAKAQTEENYAASSQIRQTCVQRDEKCSNSEECCIGTACYQGICSDGLYKNNQGPLLDQVKLIEAEMQTGNNVDVSTHPSIKFLPTLEDCGKSYLNKKGGMVHSRRKRIVGGKTYDEGKYPWMAAIHWTQVNTGKSIDLGCGASIISKRHILTAAHCITRVPSGFILKYVTVGTVDRKMKLDCEQYENCTKAFIRQHARYQDFEIEDSFTHEAYADGHARYDIAVIRLKQEINFTDTIQPICLPRSERIFKKWNDGKLTVAGWGTMNTFDETGPPKISTTAKELDMILVHRSSCDRFFTRHIGKVRRSQICVVGPPGEADCAGDSGGPLFKRLDLTDDLKAESKEERYFLFGLVSTGADQVCGRQGKPSVFTNVIDFMPWVLDHLNPKPKALGDPVEREAVNPKAEFATGHNMDVSTHRNVYLLPQECGKIEGQQDHDAPVEPAAHFRVKRVVGGIVQSIGTFPWLAQIYIKDIKTTESQFTCGGVLITSRLVLTAAHCVADIRGPYALEGVMLGNFNRQEKTECLGKDCITPNIIPIEDYFVNDGFTKYAREHDVALIKLAHDVEFNRFIQPICLPLNEEVVGRAWPHPQIDRRYVAAGWGQVTANDDPHETIYSNILIGANFTLESKKYCEGALGRQKGKLENSRICGGGSIPGRGECFGDTGGPMMRWVSEENPTGEFVTRMYAFGILSIVECAHQGIPSIYQSIVFHMPWIMDNLDA